MFIEFRSLRCRFMLLVVGSLVIDEIFLGEGERRVQVGGATLYSSIVAKKMNLEVGVISKVGYDYPEEYLNEMRTQGIDLSHVKILQDSPTTRLILRYRGEKRRLYLKGRCKPIEPQDLGDLEAEAVYITPVLDEVPRETVLEISRRCEILSLDPQGYVREGKGEEAIEPRPWFDAEALSRLKIFKSSMEELHWIAGSGDPWTAMEKDQELRSGDRHSHLGEEGGPDVGGGRALPHHRLPHDQGNRPDGGW